MDSGRWKVVEKIYHDISSQPAGQRAKALAAACSGDTELRRELESLLEAREKRRQFPLR